ncbi:MAG: amidohydrolase [Cyanobacteria bacterium HKST-UBA01]|nr:amidohydrolase [Cyanobacteria bacterium HKST-UBA01]
MTKIQTIDMYEEACSLQSRISDFRRHIHSHPELSFQETRTGLYVAEKLKEAGISCRKEVGGAGVVAEIGKGDRVFAIRVDMDALPIKETNAVQYCSKNDGVMHACGHDAHTAMGLGAALLLKKTPPTNGRVRIVFQPAEEDTNHNGKSGATLMMEDGAFDNVSGVLSLHVFPDLSSGSIAVRSGPVLAACDKFEIKIKGRGSHGAYPEFGLDPVVMSAQIVQAIQTIVSRKNSALEPLVITIGGIRSSTYAPNIISDYVELTGTVRHFYAHTRSMVKKELEQVLGIATTLGGSFDFKYIEENPPVSNDPGITALVEETALTLLGNDKIQAAEMQMGGDDFSFLSEKFPACYFFLGAMLKDSPRKLHTETFDIDENCLPVGSAMLASTALNYLKRD